MSDRIDANMRAVVQPPLFGDAPLSGQPRVAKDRQEQFREFDERHPDVYRAFRRYASLFLRQERPVAAVAILSLVRARARGGDPTQWRFRVTNTFAPYYARKLIAEDARYAQVIKLRPLRTSAVDWYAQYPS